MKEERGLRLMAEGALVVASALFLLPVALVFFTAFKPEREILEFGGLLPREWTLANFRELMSLADEAPVWRWLLNSAGISTSVTLGVLLVDSLAAFGLARLRPPGGKVVLGAIIGAMMLPAPLFLVPVYLQLAWIGWIDTPLALIVPPLAGAFGVFLLHQFFLAVPRDLEEAAAIDGCSPLGIYWRVGLPLVKGGLAALAILVFIGTWNDFIGPLVYMDSVEKYTLPVGIALFQTSYYAEYGLTLAASVVCTAPILLFFLMFQRQIVESLAFSGLKE